MDLFSTVLFPERVKKEQAKPVGTWEVKIQDEEAERPRRSSL